MASLDDGWFISQFLHPRKTEDLLFLSRTQSSVLPFNQNFSSIVKLGWRGERWAACRSPDVSETILKLYLRPLRSGRPPCENTNHSLSLSESYICISNNQHISVRGRGLYADRRLTKPVCTFCTLYRARVGACVNRFFVAIRVLPITVYPGFYSFLTAAPGSRNRFLISIQYLEQTCRLQPAFCC